MPLKWYFKIDKGRPLGPQIENNIKTRIAFGLGNNNEQLPSSRKLAAVLQVSPLTVQRAYNNLIAENVLYSRERTGTFINPSPVQQTKRAYSPQRASFQTRKLAGTTSTGTPCLILGNEFPAVADIDFYKHISNFRTVYDHMKAKKNRNENLHLIPNKLLDSTLSRRNIYVREDEQLLVNDLELCLRLTLECLTSTGDTIAICTGSYPNTFSLGYRERKMVDCPTDENGLPSLDHLSKLVSDKLLKAIIIYSPDRFDAMSADFDRKRELFIDFAVAHELAIIELDKDHEFWFETRSTSLKANYTTCGNIIYISPISKLAPYLYNIAAVTGPASFINLLKQRYSLHEQMPDPLLYSAANYFMDTRKSKGIIRKLQTRYQRRREQLYNMMLYNSKLDAQVLLPVAGLWSWIILHEPIYAYQLKDLPASFHPYVLSHPEEKPIRHICLGISSFRSSDLQKLVSFLEKAIHKHS